MCPDYGTRRYIVGMFNRRRHDMKKQTIRIENRIPFAELGKAIGTTDKEYKAHMGTGFAVKDPVNPKRKHEIRRADFEDVPEPMQCWYLSDEAMQAIAEQITQAMTQYEPDYIRITDDFDSAFWREEEEALRAFGVPYYSDEVKAPKKGARVFSVDYGYATYLGKTKDGKAEILTDDWHHKITYIGLIVEEY